MSDAPPRRRSDSRARGVGSAAARAPSPRSTPSRRLLSSRSSCASGSSHMSACARHRCRGAQPRDPARHPQRVEEARVEEEEGRLEEEERAGEKYEHRGARACPRMDSRLPSEEATTNQGWHHSDTPPMAQESAGRGASAPAARAPPHQSRDEAAPARANRATCASARGARARGRRCGSRHRRSAATAAKAAPQASAAPQPLAWGEGEGEAA